MKTPLRSLLIATTLVMVAAGGYAEVKKPAPAPLPENTWLTLRALNGEFRAQQAQIELQIRDARAKEAELDAHVRAMARDARVDLMKCVPDMAKREWVLRQGQPADTSCLVPPSAK